MTVEKNNDKAQSPEQSRDSIGLYLAEIAKTPLLTAEQEVELGQAIEVGLFAGKLREARETVITGGELSEIDPEITEAVLAKYAHTSDEELDMLIDLGAKAKDHFVKANLRLVVSVAKRYARNLNLLDGIQEGSAGVIRGVEKFDYTKGYKFSTYGTWWIRQAVTRAAAKGHTISVPVHRDELLRKYQAVRRRLAGELQDEPTIEELAAELGLTVEDVMGLEQDTHLVMSLNYRVGENGESEFGDLLAHDEGGHDVASRVQMSVLRQQLMEALQVLDSREQEVLQRWFGLESGCHETQSEIAEDMGITGERVRQIKLAALKKLRLHKNKEDIRALLEMYGEAG